MDLRSFPVDIIHMIRDYLKPDYKLVLEEIRGDKLYNTIRCVKYAWCEKYAVNLNINIDIDSHSQEYPPLFIIIKSIQKFQPNDWCVGLRSYDCALWSSEKYKELLEFSKR